MHSFLRRRPDFFGSLMKCKEGSTFSCGYVPPPRQGLGLWTLRSFLVACAPERLSSSSVSKSARATPEEGGVGIWEVVFHKTPVIKRGHQL